MTTPILEFENIARAYKQGVPVLRDVTFSMQPAEVVGLLGRNGAGKTTLIRLAMGMLFPHAGAVRVFGLSPTADPVAVKRRVGYVSEEQVFPPKATVGEVISLHRYLFPQWDAAMERRLLDRFALSPNSRIKTLSKGQARQAALLCAVCHRPDLLILDEPAAGLDPAARREFLETSIQLLNREGSAILFSSHMMTDVERIGARIVLLDEGSVRLDCGLDTLREETCVALVPRASAPDASAIQSAPGCLRVRPVFEEWHAVFAGSPEAVRARLQARLGTNGIRCLRVPLEELFIELVGGDR